MRTPDTFILGALLAFTLGAHAQTTSLERLIGTAEAKSPLLKAYANQRASTELQRDLIRAQQAAPRVSLSAGYLFAPFFKNNGHLISTAPLPEAIGYDASITNGGLYSALINVEQPLFTGATVDALEREQDVQSRSASSLIALARRDIARQVTDQYLLAYQAQKNWELAKANAANLHEALQIVGRLVEQGAARQADYLLLSVEMDNAAIETGSAKAGYDEAYSRLCTLCGLEDTADIAIDSVALEEHAPAVHPEFTQKYEFDSLGLSLQQVQTEAKYRPQLTVFFNTGLNAVETEHIERKFGLSAGFNLSVPLYDGNQRSITRQQSELSKQTVAAEKEQFALQMRNEVSASRARLASLRERLGHYAGQRTAYDRLRELAARDLAQGQMSVVEYLAMQRRTIELRKSMIQAETELEREINSYNYWN